MFFSVATVQLLWLLCGYACITQFIFHSPFDGHLGCFPALLLWTEQLWEWLLLYMSLLVHGRAMSNVQLQEIMTMFAILHNHCPTPIPHTHTHRHTHVDVSYCSNGHLLHISDKISIVYLEFSSEKVKRKTMHFFHKAHIEAHRHKMKGLRSCQI